MAGVLLLEPDPVLGDVYRQLLELRGYTVYWQQSADEAIQAMDELEVSLALVELQLAGHNGLEFLYELRSYADWQDVPVVIHSMVPPEKVENTLTYRQLNITEYLYKPTTTLASLNQAVEAALTA